MDKGSDLLKVTDFGLAKDFGGVDAKLSTSCGTPDFAGTLIQLQVFVWHALDPNQVLLDYLKIAYK